MPPGNTSRALRLNSAARRVRARYVARIAESRRAPAAHRERPRDLAHVEIVLRIERETVRRGEAARRSDLGGSPARENLSVLVVDAHARVAGLLDHLAFAIILITFVPSELGHV